MEKPSCSRRVYHRTVFVDQREDWLMESIGSRRQRPVSRAAGASGLAAGLRGHQPPAGR